MLKSDLKRELIIFGDDATRIPCSRW